MFGPHLVARDGWRASCEDSRTNYHVYILQNFDQVGRGSLTRPFQFLNLSEDDLRKRVLEAWETGRGITWGGETADPAQITSIKVYETESPAPELRGAEASGWMKDHGRDVTNDYITGPAGSQAPAAAASASGAPSPLRDARRVMVVHGRNEAARVAMFHSLRALGLGPD